MSISKRRVFGIPLAMLAVGSLLTTATGCSEGRERAARAGQRVVVIGFDGVDPDFLEQWSEALPTMKRLMRDGSFLRLQTTTPPASCTAWASFATGMNPGGHGVFDFVTRHPESYLPDRNGPIRHAAQYRWRLFQTKPETFDATMSGEPFWAHVDAAGVRSVVLRVPCMFPLAALRHGRAQAGLGVPDVRGTEGTFHFWSTGLTAVEAADAALGGKVQGLAAGPEIETLIEGPLDPLSTEDERLTVPLVLRPRPPGVLEIELDGRRETLDVGSWSPWLRMRFSVTPFSGIAAMARFRLLRVEPHVELYMSAINHDPRAPAIAVTEPPRYAQELQAAAGDFKTVGWNHETWGLNEERIDERAFLEDVADSMAETEKILLRELDRADAELVVAVFTETDRVSHMMYRLLDPQHPLYDAGAAAEHGDAILRTYERMDEIVAEVLGRLGSDDVLLVASDHGFHSWRRGFNVNTWLVEQGYMKLQGGARSTHRPFLVDVDWGNTKAYALGLGAVYLNVRGREAMGTVEPGAEYERTARELAHRLEQVVDPATGERVVEKVYLAAETWKGNRLAEAQDLQLGLAPGYRVSSATPLGGAPDGVFEDNRRKWSGEHAASRAEVTEGVLLSNRRIEQATASIVDLAPTVVALLGVAPPAQYEGTALTFAPRSGD